MAVENMKLRAQELLARMGPDLYREAYGRGMSLSAWLEREDPSDGYQDGLDAFSRLLKVADIRTRSIPELGIYASEFDAFEANPQVRSLVPELLGRMWRRAATGRDVMTRTIYGSDDAVPGSLTHAYADAAAARSKQIAPAIPLSELVALTTPINSDSYRAYYLTDVTAQERMVRVAEGSDVPAAKLTGGDHTITLKKYGRALEVSYEALRRTRLDRLALHIARLSVQNEVDKVAAALTILVSGDGNANTAATNHNLMTLDTSTSSGVLTLKAWLSFKMQFANPYVCQVAITREANALLLLLLNTGSANVPLVQVQAAAGYGGFSQINPGLRDNVGLGWTSDAPANVIVGIDTRFALERVIEIGANIEEVQRWATRQTQALVMTEIEGFAVFDQNATKTLTTNA